MRKPPAHYNPPPMFGLRTRWPLRIVSGDLRASLPSVSTQHYDPLTDTLTVNVSSTRMIGVSRNEIRIRPLTSETSP